MEAVAAVLAPCEESLGWIVAPSYDVCDRTFQNVREIMISKLKHRIIEIDNRWRRIVVRNLAGGSSELRAKSADHAVSLLGEGLDWLVVDEAASLKSAIWQGHLSQRLIDRDGWALLISTPKGGNWFWDVYRLGMDGDPDYQSWNFPSTSNPLLDADVIERERERLPAQVFAEQYGAEFILDEPLRCNTCGYPKPRGFETISLFKSNDEQPGECPDCGGPTDMEGRSTLVRLPGGGIVEEWIRLFPGSRTGTALPGLAGVQNQEDAAASVPAMN